MTGSVPLRGRFRHFGPFLLVEDRRQFREGCFMPRSVWTQVGKDGQLVGYKPNDPMSNITKSNLLPSG
jgi:hypothetical protein